MTHVSVVIVNWNTHELLRSCLQSVARESGSLQVEVFVADNGSSDGSPEMVRDEFPYVHLITNKQNLGFARACNQALCQACGQTLLLLNTDAQLLPGSLSALYQYLMSHTKVGAVGPELVDQDGARQNAVDHFPNLMTELFNKNWLKLLFPKWYPGKYSHFTESVEVPALIGAAMLVRREVPEKIGLLDESFFFFMEETDWCYRMRQDGWKIAHLPQARVLHLGGETAKKFVWRAKVEYYRSRYRFFRKHRSLLSVVILAVGLLLKIAGGILLTASGTVLSFGKGESQRRRLQQYARLFLWHLKGCPPAMGLSIERPTS